MPPKKKPGKKGPKGKTPTVVDGLSTEEMSKEQLEEHIVRLREELDREREERNYFQLERDKIHTFWEITKRDFEDKKAELRNRDREMEEAEERHQAEIKVYKQKVKHLLYEHQNSVSELKAEGVVITKVMQEEYSELESELLKEMKSLKMNLRDHELSKQSLIKSIKLKHEEEITNIRNDCERLVREIESKYEKKMQILRQEQDQRRKTENHALEENKNAQISTLMKNHEKAFSDMKNYYNDITINNLALINSLKEQVEEMKKKEERLEKEMAEVQLQKRRLTEPLQKAKEDVAELQKKLANYEKDKASLAGAKARLKVADKNMKDLKWEHEVLLQSFNKVQAERDELYQKFIKAIQEVQQKSGFKNLLLEKKLGGLIETLEKKEAQLNEVLSASNLDPTAVSVATRKLEETLDTKNNTIKDLQYELARACKAHNDLLRTSEAKLVNFGIPVAQLGFKPLECSLNRLTLGAGPSGLVSANIQRKDVAPRATLPPLN
ncbi:dynein regulatory complex subunit 4 [Alosa pseudoharengus]|uniref:dynein regulatory complex subunit 4 n=1 Tax=Alosa pseudoharengus TaxID=34774 RepID=UPI001C089096|nr:dynein regulatory complex subunit 4 isoform X1 [Alosa sapidissima]